MMWHWLSLMKFINLRAFAPGIVNVICKVYLAFFPQKPLTPGIVNVVGKFRPRLIKLTSFKPKLLIKLIMNKPC